jgi:glycerophosphoryl diester phosphodiesterase
MSDLTLWAHRGASTYSPENTMTAFKAAVQDGADGLEMDVQLSRDEVPVIIHDQTLERTTNGKGPINLRTWRQLQRLDAGRWFSEQFKEERIPCLDEILIAFGTGIKLNLEIKTFEAGQIVFDRLQHVPNDHIIISSFNYRLLEFLRSLDSKLRLAVLFGAGNWHRAIKLARDLNATAFHCADDQVCRPMIRACHQLGFVIYVWTIDDPSRAKALMRCGVDGLFTNDPGLLRRSL